MSQALVQKGAKCATGNGSCCPTQRGSVMIGARVAVPVRPYNTRVVQGRQPLRVMSAVLGTGPNGINVQGHRPTSPQGWAAMAKALKEANVKVLSPQEATWAAEKGAVIIDVRPADLFAKGRVPGAKNVPFYRPITGWSPWQVARRIGYLFLGVVEGTEVNPNFTEEVLALLPEGSKEQQFVLYCSLGGSLEPTMQDKNGQQTRSIVAAYVLSQQGVKNVAVIKGGWSEWANSGRDIEGAAKK